MAFLYKQSTGELSEEGSLLGVGYSGAGNGRNNPGMQAVPDVGPIPVGFYDIGEAFTHPHAGPGCMRLIPRPGTNTFGRSGFMMHGNNATNNASEGCIIMEPKIRAHVNEAHDKILQVVQ